MYKMIIVDDEYLVRYGIEQTIDWPKYNIEVVGDAKNGKEGLVLAKEKTPDIIISDVRMPLMDGLDFVKAIAENNMDAIIIMLSGYKDFDYAKETLENGAFCYLLKPIDNQELIDVVLKGIEELEKRRKIQLAVDLFETDKSMIANSIIQQLLTKPEINLELVKKLQKYSINLPSQGFLLYAKEKTDEINNSSTKIAFSKELHQFLCEHNIPCILVEETGSFCLIIKTTKDDLLIPLIYQKLKRYEEKNHILYSIGISSLYKDYMRINDYYEEAKRLANSSLVLSTSTIISSSNEVKHIRQSVCDVLHYIAQNSVNNINISSASLALKISESHLMHLLKDEVGKTFNECLTLQRINEAKRLLLQNNNRIYEVAERVGISDAKYFSQVFKKVVGISPAEFIVKMTRGKKAS